MDATTNVPKWQVLFGSAIGRKHSGDIDGAIEDMIMCVTLTKPDVALAEYTATNLNYLADLYLTKNETDCAESILRESIELSRFRFPHLYADNLCILGGIQRGMGKHQEALASAQESLRICEAAAYAYGVTRAKQLISIVENSLLTAEPPKASEPIG